MARRTGPGAASEAPGESAGERHNAANVEGVRAFRRWVQQAGVARYSVEMAAHYTELEISRFTSMLRARLSVLTDMEMVLYLALLLGPQVMAASLHDVLQQRAGAALRVGQRFPPDLAHALPIRRPCALGSELGARPSSLRRSSPATTAVPSHAAHGVPHRMPTPPAFAAPNLQPPGSASTPSVVHRRLPAGGRPSPAPLVQDPRTIPIWPLTAPATPHGREQGCTEQPSPAQSSYSGDASSEDSTPRRPTRRRLDY